MKRFRQIHHGILLLCVLVAGAKPAGAVIVAHYEMNSPTQLVNSVGNFTGYNPDFVDPGGGASPTYLPTGGYLSSGAFQFNGTSQYLAYGGVGYTFIAPAYSNWTVSMWIKTTDTGSNFGTYAGTPQIDVFGNNTGGIGFGLGIEGGKPAYAKYGPSGWENALGTQNVADGNGHFITFVAIGSSNLSIYVDGFLDTADLAVPPEATASQLGLTVGLSYNNHFSAFTLDDLRIYDHALTAAEVFGLFAIPEPSTVVLLTMGGLMFWQVSRRRRR